MEVIRQIQDRLATYATTDYRQWLDTSVADISALLSLLNLANGEIDALRLWRESASKKLGRAYSRYQRVARAFKVANRERHHAQARADDLAAQRNSWRDGFQDMQRKRNEAEKERDSWKREVDACHAIMAKVREIWGADTLTVDAAQGVQDRISELNAEQSVMDDTLDMVGAPQCGDPFMPERITRVQMLGDKIEKQSSELDACWDVIGSQFGSMAGAMVASSEKRLKAKQDTV